MLGLYCFCLRSPRIDVSVLISLPFNDVDYRFKLITTALFAMFCSAIWARLLSSGILLL